MSLKTKLISRISKINKIKIFTFKHNLKAIINLNKKKFNGFLSNSSNLTDHFIIHENRLSNDFYGIASALKKYSGYNKKLPVFIEHGVYFGDFVNEEEISEISPGLITFGDVRKKHIKSKADIPVICIGPYIKYVESYFSDKVKDKIKKKYGKILLVFPQHTIEGVTIKDNDELFINKIKEIKEKKKCDNVFISLYYREARGKYYELYKKNGFIPICCGNRQDPNFLPRLKSFIECSELTLSNNVGTHVGYCYALGKEHVIIDSQNSLSIKNKKYQKNVPELYLELAKFEKNEIKKAYTHGKEDDIKRVICKYWGNNYFYSKEEMNLLFKTFNRVIKRSKREKVSYQVALKTILKEDITIRKLFERKKIL